MNQDDNVKGVHNHLLVGGVDISHVRTNGVRATAQSGVMHLRNARIISTILSPFWPRMRLVVGGGGNCQKTT